MIWNKKYECMERKDIENLQLERFNEVIQRVYDHVPFYRKKFDKEGIRLKKIKSLKDIRNFPFTTKSDFRDNYPFGLIAVPFEKIEEFHTSSGTTGKPVVNGYTKKDIQIWAEVVARGLTAIGVRRNDIIQNAYGYGLFTGGIGHHYGVQLIGAKIIPASGGQTKRQVMIMKDFKSTVLTCTPSYALHIAEIVKEMGVDIKNLSLRMGNLGAETWSENMRGEIEERLNIEAFDVYGLTEIIGPGVANECKKKNGLHIFEDHFLPEVIDPKTGEVLLEGEEGELIITTLTREGTPLIRFRTGDITSLNYELCKCGRTQVRMSRIKGRTDDMLTIRGVNVFPSQIENILMQIEGAEPHYQLILERKRGLDELTVEVETSPEIFSDEVKRLEILEGKIARGIEEALGLRIRVRLVEPKSIKRSMGKAKRLIDKRNLK
ncbi:phenylacetate--CoA ligase [Candidatus Aerophobetes bacterium]|nr:phenylacetate--CoA ligase [Candidatus Aerophobetes bacterium]